MNSTLQSALLGVLSGAAGVITMHFYWKAVTKLTGDDPRSLTRDEPPDALDEMGVVGQQHKPDEASTEAAGRILYETVMREEPDEETKVLLSQGIHWDYGLAMGGLYGLIRGRAEAPDAAGGLLFGTALWLLGDELMVPLLGLSKGPTAFPLEQHVHRFGAHLAYGLATSAVTQVLQDLTATSPRGLVWGTAKTYAKWKAAKGAGRLALKSTRKLLS